MRARSRLAIQIGIGAILLAVQEHAAPAVEIKILCVPALQTSLEVLGPQFERATGNKLNISYAGSSELVRRFAAGETFDVALVWPAQIDRLVKEANSPVERARRLPASQLRWQSRRASRSPISAPSRHSNERCSTPNLFPIRRRVRAGFI